MPLPNVSGKILSKIIEYCAFHTDPVKDEKSGSKSEEEVKAWDADFMKVDQATLFELILVRFLRITVRHQPPAMSATSALTTTLAPCNWTDNRFNLLVSAPGLLKLVYKILPSPSVHHLILPNWPALTCISNTSPTSLLSC